MAKTAWALSVAVFGAGCGEVNAQAPAARAKVSAYTGADTHLFDDVIEGFAAGIDVDMAPTRRTDPTFQARAQRADEVVRVRVTTVSSRRVSGVPVYDLVLVPLARVGGKGPSSKEFTFSIRRESPAYGIVHRLEDNLTGRTFIGFFRAFATEGGAPETHGHLAPDSPEVVAAVKEALALDEVR